MIEHNNIEILKLCSLLVQRHKAEIAYLRATYRVSYYRRIRARLDEKNSLSSKWMNNALELAKKIEHARLMSLKKNRDFLAVKIRLQSPIASCCKKANALLAYRNGRIIGVNITIANNLPHTIHIPEVEFAEKAAQYEAIHAMNKMLASK